MEISGRAPLLRSDLDVPPGRRGTAVLRVADPARGAEPWRGTPRLIALLAKLETVEVVQGGADPQPAGAGVAGSVEVFLPWRAWWTSSANVSGSAKELAKVDGWIKGCRAKLGNEKFVASAPAAGGPAAARSAGGERVDRREAARAARPG